MCIRDRARAVSGTPSSAEGQHGSESRRSAAAEPTPLAPGRRTPPEGLCTRQRPRVGRRRQRRQAQSPFTQALRPTSLGVPCPQRAHGVTPPIPRNERPAACCKAAPHASSERARVADFADVNAWTSRQTPHGERAELRVRRRMRTPRVEPGSMPVSSRTRRRR